jgi:GDPmannose 4,6-dehydratase
MTAAPRKTALILGVSGQDGAYLARLLLDRGYRVVGTSRDAAGSRFENLRTLGIRERLELTSAVPTDFRSVAQVLMASRPDEIYNLAGQSSVGLSFEQPVESLESIAFGTLNLLEAIRLFGLDTRFYNACSSECFGDTKGLAADENTPFYPRSPYGVAKATSHWEVVNYREAYGLFACSGILFNHESPLRPTRFVTRKVIAAAWRIARGSAERLKLGDLSIRRDWGWAPEYVEAMARMLQQSRPADYVIATGETNSLETFVAAAFEVVGLDWRAHVDHDSALLRPSDIAASTGNPTRARVELGWEPKLRMRDVVKLMMDAERANGS